MKHACVTSEILAKFWSENIKEVDLLNEISVDGKINLKCLMWIGLIWL
jgi:hypothetical protein